MNAEITEFRVTCFCKPVTLTDGDVCTTCGRQWLTAEAAAAAAAAVETVTLPVTGKVVPADAARWTVKPRGRMNTREGEAFNAEVYDGKILVGTIENQGTGGGTWFMPHGREARESWAAMVDAFRPMSEFPALAEEDLADVLYDEVALAAEMNRKRNGAVMLNEDRDQILLFNVPMDDRLRAHVRTTYGDTARVWIKKEGWAAP